MNWIKRIFCKHDYEFVRNIYGDEINNGAGKRSEWRCRKCGKTIYKNEIRLDLDNTHTLCSELRILSQKYDDNLQADWEQKHARLINNTISDLRKAAKKGLYRYEGYVILEDKDVRYFRTFILNQKLNLHMQQESPDHITPKKYYMTISWSLY